MSIVVNGEPRSIAGETLEDLLRELDLAPELLLIEHNGTALLRSEWTGRRLAEGDRIELLRVAAGG